MKRLPELVRRCLGRGSKREHLRQGKALTQPLDKNLHPFPGVTVLDHDPDVLLRLAAGKLDEVVIMGYDKQGNFFFSSNKADGGAVLWLIEVAKQALMTPD